MNEKIPEKERVDRKTWGVGYFASGMGLTVDWLKSGILGHHDVRLECETRTSIDDCDGTGIIRRLS